MSSESPRDVLILYCSRLVRLFAFGAVAPLLVLHLRSLGFDDTLVGTFLSLTLLGDVLLSAIVTWSADALGRRRVLAVGAILMAASGIVFHLSSSFVFLLIAAVVGIISPSGNETGPFSAIEVGMLSQLVNPDARVFVLMWYQVAGFVGTSLGAISSGWLVTMLLKSGWQTIVAYRAVFLAYTVASGVKIVLSLSLTPQTELATSKNAAVPQAQAVDNVDERQPLLQEPRESTVNAAILPPDEPVLPRLPLGRLVALCFIFSLDSFASSVLPNSYISYYFRIAFGAPLSIIASTFAAGSILGGVSQLAAGAIARRLGIVPTMVGTHIPAQVVTILIGFAPSLSSALVLYIIRASTASMDTSVRGALLAGLIPAEHRVRFLGIVNVCKTLASAPGPTLSGQLAKAGQLRWTFVLCGGLKIIYDLALLAGFAKAKLEH